VTYRVTHVADLHLHLRLRAALRGTASVVATACGGVFEEAKAFDLSFRQLGDDSNAGGVYEHERDWMIRDLKPVGLRRSRWWRLIVRERLHAGTV